MTSETPVEKQADTVKQRTQVDAQFCLPVRQRKRLAGTVTVDPARKQKVLGTACKAALPVYCDQKIRPHQVTDFEKAVIDASITTARTRRQAGVAKWQA
ncbi:hypothetical protein [Thalassovita sp.]|uniref:hypothetical protein n=1 Tax=Thalassovita sp. TaxID=1979401 RepID=UPI0029DE83D5|nr:hypothetical protein [Thalassovita sp.]